MKFNSIRKAVVVTGILAGAALGGTTAAAAANTVQQGTSQQTATSWVRAGSFPDPISCYIAGLTSGHNWYCSWQIFWWDLYIEV